MEKTEKTTKRVPITEFWTNETVFQECIQDLKNGEVVAIPTDTLYGFAIDANSERGIRRLYQIKGRDEQKPLILFLDALEKLSDLSIFPEDRILSLLKKHWPGPLTAIFPLNPGILSAFPNQSLGIRIPNHPGLLKVLQEYPGFLLTTSANRSGLPPIFNPEEIDAEFSGEISWILDSGRIPLSEPSTVADMRYWPPKILRAGKIQL